ncbi:MAG TPA: electron transfer flavoprotein beta subunit/FixA family protein [Candidatus Eisenbacteria bacterium]|nr:electron transfer flavoprotein beta subunit/FixA family protein [Candidatus Eisenbacteria bacterium]
MKRVPQTGGRIVLTADGQDIDTRYLGFTISPHEECGVEEAVRIVEAQGGSSAVLTLGPVAAEDQLRDAMALGIERAILLETDGSEWDPVSTAAAIVEAVRAQEAANGPFDLLLFGNESADSGGFQVGIRVAVALGRPVVNGIKGLAFRDGTTIARREAPGGGVETYELPLPAVIGVKEGINLPRYPSVPGRLRARRKEIVRVAVGAAATWAAGAGAAPAGAGTEPAAGAGSVPRGAGTEPVAPRSGPTKVDLRLPTEERTAAEVIGRGPEAAPAVVDLLERIGVVAR